MTLEQLKNIKIPVIIMPMHLHGILLYHALINAGVNVTGFWDNDKTLNGKTYDGISITMPGNAGQTAIDAAIIVFHSVYGPDICKQLADLGCHNVYTVCDFEQSKLEKYHDCVLDENLSDIFPRYKRVLCTEYRSYPLQSVPLATDNDFFDFISEKNGKPDNKRGARKVLLISHHMGLNGATVALHKAAKAISVCGGTPVVCCSADGDMVSGFIDNGIPVIIDYRLTNSNLILALVSFFDVVFVNTLLTNLSIAMIERLNTLSVPVVCWIHEPGWYYTEDKVKKLPDVLRDNVHLYCVGNYARTIFHKHAGKDVLADILLYGIDDLAKQYQKSASKRIRIMTLGSVQPRKGQDILCEAIRKMDCSIRDRCEFHFVGKPVNLDGADKVYEAMTALKDEFPDNVVLHGEVEYGNICNILRQCDCMICASRDDPMPVFIAEAMMFSAICICSENTGYVDLIKDGINGYIYRRDNSDELCKKIEHVVQNYYLLDEMRTESRRVFEEYFTFERFSGNLMQILDTAVSS